MLNPILLFSSNSIVRKTFRKLMKCQKSDHMVVLSNSDIASSKIKLKTIKTFKICKVYGKYSDEDHTTLHNLVSLLFEMFFLSFYFQPNVPSHWVQRCGFG